MTGPSDVKPPGPPVEVYCDETLDRGGFDLIGGLWIPRPKARRLREIIRGIRDQYNYPYEFKWKKAGGTRLSPAYKELVTKVMDQIMARRMAFHCIAIRKELVDYDRFHEGDPELGYYKFVHWLMRKRIQPGETYIITMDRRTTREDNRLIDLRRVLNHCGRKDHGLGHDCCREVRAKPSGEDDLLQVADVLLGAVGYHYGGYHRDSEASIAKNDLADRIAGALQKPDLCFASPKSERRFNIWRWSPQERE